jgi:hypothetical protein
MTPERVGLRLLLVMTCLTMFLSVAVAQYAEVKADFVAAKPVVNIFSKNSADSDVVSQALYGTGVTSVKHKHKWILIRTADGYTGWIHKSDVQALKSEYAPDGKVVRVSELSANLYREPDVTKHAPLMNLPWESRLEVLPEKVGEGGRWLAVKLVNGDSAYVQRGDVNSEFTPRGIDETLQLARKFLGITYTWGGVSSFGFDCSGFTQMLVRQRGIIMPRDADIQASWSGVTPVKREELAPGDLLFFGADDAHITHTGMYIGGGEFIHDTTHGHPSVQISKLNDAYWTKLLVAARRVKQ